ncbi:glycosyltransferase domain-containing protein [uncultured Tateyamaria sp.]|uniref:glycosyltransferase domain-containing protein n=1 Tax=uncultured Tateyamaria sp. TaxID=455651 RepID=UPI0026198B51|nr:glycosyltransferase domain-containing protein [uncultured Tateyamaria sp.]
MGLSQSFRRRLKIVKGESFSRAVEIFFAGRKKRRAFEFQKFGHYLTGDDLTPGGTVLWSETDVIHGSLDIDWYAHSHGIDGGAKECLDHYLVEGRKRALAPNSALAGTDGKTLSAWGLEFLVRCGVMIGDTGEKYLSPGDERAIDPFRISNPGGKKFAVVTSIFGDYDKLMPVDSNWSDTADFFLFSDRYFDASKTWQHVHSPYHHVDPRRRARFVKLNLPVFFHAYEWVIWIDANMLLCHNPQAVVEGVADTPFDFATFRHSSRNSIMAEAAACVHLGKENLKDLSEHFARIDISSREPGKKLFETMAMVLRPSSPAVQKLFTKWWGLLLRGSKRDQLSLPIALADVPEIQFEQFSDTIDNSTDFFRAKHSSKAN